MAQENGGQGADYDSLEVSTTSSSKATPDRPTRGDEDTPRRFARKRALEYAKNLEPAQKRSVVVGRPSWPADERS